MQQNLVSSLLILLTLSACSSKPMNEAYGSLNKADQISDEFLLFTAKPTNNTVCMVFYPGALIDPAAYSPLSLAIANKGYDVYLLKLTLNLAVLEIDAADKAKQDKYAKQHCRKFLIAGHSLGGAMAVEYVKKHPEDSLLLLGAYPQESTNLTSHKPPVTVVSGSQDKIASPEEIMQSRGNMPKHSDYIEIDGGNHAQFGWYGSQRGDGTATISRQRQHEIVVDKVLELLKRIDKGI